MSMILAKMYTGRENDYGKSLKIYDLDLLLKQISEKGRLSTIEIIWIMNIIWQYTAFQCIFGE